MLHRASFLLGAVLTSLALTACSSVETTEIEEPNVIAGLAEAASNDTTSGPPPTPANPTPGSFHGYVIGPGTGPDTIATAPRVAGTVITAYPHTGWVGSEPTVGPAAASVTADANGFFQTPTIPGGEYVVTFVPPSSSPFRGVFVMTTIFSGSSTGTWWVLLPFK